MRHDAKPQECYIDGRVESVLKDIYDIGKNLTSYDDEKWKTLRNRTLEIFKAQAKREHDEHMEDGKNNS